MLLGCLTLLMVPYSLAIVQGRWIDTPPMEAKGETLAVVLCAVGLFCCIPAELRPWRYATAVTCAVLAPVAAVLFHEQLVAQAWSVVPLMFAAVFVRTWHRASVARVVAVAIWVIASIGLLVAPADIPVLWLISYGVSIIGAAEVCGAASTALLNAALRDPLTAVWNRAGVENQARRVLAQAQRRHEPMAVIVLDFDDFKSVNDRDGHSAGDAALGEFTDLVVDRLPAAAVFGRLGGDEFVVILGGCDEAAAHQLATTLIDGHLVHVSFGVASGPAESGSLARLFDVADADLYRRKRARKEAGRPG
ncbi:hypothetical protein BH11ACT6_BH11ACT6_11350 [soil metagenome]